MFRIKLRDPDFGTFSAQTSAAVGGKILKRRRFAREAPPLFEGGLLSGGPLLQVRGEEIVQFVKRYEVCLVIKVDMARALYIAELLWFRGALVGVFAELFRVRLVARYEEHRARGDRLYILKRIEVHELYRACEGRVRRGIEVLAFARRGSARRAVKIVKFLLDGIGLRVKRVRRAAQEPALSALELGVALLCRGGDISLSLFHSLRLIKRVTHGLPHIVHRYRGYGLDARVDLRGAYEERTAAADAYAADPLTVDEIARPKVIDRGHEGFGVEVGVDAVARRTVARAPERQVDSERGKSAVCHLLRVKRRALLLHGAHRVADNDRGELLPLLVGLWYKESAGDLHVELIFERDVFRRYFVALIEVVRAVVGVLRSRSLFRERGKPRVRVSGERGVRRYQGQRRDQRDGRGKKNFLCKVDRHLFYFLSLF